MPEALENERERISRDLLTEYLARQAQQRQQPAPVPAPTRPGDPVAVELDDPYRPVVMRSANSTSL